MLDILQTVSLVIGITLCTLAFLWRGVVGIAMHNNGGEDPVSKTLAWIVCAPFLLVGLLLIHWALTI